MPKSSFRRAIWKTNAWYLFCLELTFTLQALVLIRFFPGYFLRKWNVTTVSSAAQLEGVYRNFYVCWCIPKHISCNVCLDWHCLSPAANLQQENSNGGPLLLTQACVYANRAESIKNGWDFFPSVTCTAGESESTRLERLFIIYWDLKKMCGWICTIIGCYNSFTHCSHTTMYKHLIKVIFALNLNFTKFSFVTVRLWLVPITQQNGATLTIKLTVQYFSVILDMSSSIFLKYPSSTSWILSHCSLKILSFTLSDLTDSHFHVYYQQTSVFAFYLELVPLTHYCSKV